MNPIHIIACKPATLGGCQKNTRERADVLKVRYDENLGLVPLLGIANSNTRGKGLLQTHCCAVRERSSGTRY